ncbi:D-glycero-beta-D-manno-heptose 1-phosphate adenylyltransferase [Roseivirga misakiensis]|uniref:D-glycero-beta-D-manno-heptose 1-phosphate adenylyltransferase n=1 Tax=Roseivirga misakiensis TaxID=1563681 RepID=A0A1E5T3I3_9BACT|nr:D-glycero-beta-D-manno-heptose 1-phosphate adenylyltransferase [Roseivirga misakiensis]OEK05916.1 D-beta-D-heptose 1-phosphate adenosyltransferase [Roseivirga misakiensis]
MEQTAQKVLSKKNLKQKVIEWQSQNLKVVFSNGCFDILHLGHIDYLEKASAQGDKLVIGLNSDNSVRLLKGENRPINNEEARARMLAALAFVDGVAVFDEETPKELIEYLLPNVLVKGSDYNVENIVGAKSVIANGGTVNTIDLVDGYSTTSIIEKIKK